MRELFLMENTQKYIMYATKSNYLTDTLIQYDQFIQMLNFML